MDYFIKRDSGRFPFNKILKLRFEISEIPRTQWNGTFRLHRPHPSNRAFGYCSCKQDTKEQYWGQHFCQMEKDILVRPTRPLKEDHKMVPNIPVGPNWNGPFHLTYQRKFPEFWVEWKPPTLKPNFSTVIFYFFIDQE